MTKPRFAADRATGDYYDQRAPEYDDWYTGQGLFSERDRPGWEVEVDQVVQLLHSLPSARTLDVACGTGFLTRHVPGAVVGVDQSPAMAAIARSRLRSGPVIVGDALHLAVADGAFDRVLTGHFYGHLPLGERETFLNEVRRVARELVVIDSACRPGVGAEEWQERVLNNGSRHRIYKRYLSGDQLADEIGGQKLLNGCWFIAARTCWDGHHQNCETEQSLSL
ncbi:MAG TPA: methyltransferase domain-containing protein [Acidimicrobiales bacterium]|nr:methyltransferase domain-containing protein [Acidimicrobiales bacterium]